MTPARSTLAVLLTAAGVLVTGCAFPADQDPGLMPAEPPTAIVYEYSHSGDRYRLHHAEARVPERLEGQTAFTSDSMRGIAALLDHVPRVQSRSTLWNGDCAPGEEVVDVVITRQRVTVQLEGWNGTVCDIDQGALDARDQQLAWTVIVNDKARFSAPPFPEVVVRDGSGETWDPIQPDDSYLPPGEEY